METRILLIVAAAHIWLGAGAARGLLHRRDSDFDRPGEHVILANCETSSGQKSSQMAYFLGVPTSRPEELTTVRTGSFAIWEDRNNTGTYPRNGAQFTSSLVGGVDEGGFAGVGENNWEHFTCWKRTLKNLYKDGGKTCDGVYDCNHDPKPTPTATSSTATDDAAKDKPSDASKAIAQVQTSSSPTVQPDVQPQQSSPVPSESVGLYGESLPPMRSSFTKILPDGEKESTDNEKSSPDDDQSSGIPSGSSSNETPRSTGGVSSGSRENDPPEGKFLNTGAAIGSIVGGITGVLTILISWGIYVWRTRQKRKKEEEEEEAWRVEKERKIEVYLDELDEVVVPDKETKK